MAPACTSYFKLYRFASKLDILLVFLGTFGAIAHGLTYPAVIYQFGRINNALGDSVQDSSHAYDEITEVLVQMAYMGLAILFVAATETICWMLAGENITAEIKRRYLQSLLSQEVGFYDMNVKSGAIIAAVSSDTLLIHDAVGEKVGVFINCLSQCISGIIFNMTIFWKLGLVGMTSIPLLLGAGALYMVLYTKYSARAQLAYQQADQATEEALSQVRTVYSFTGESKTLAVISNSLQQAVNLSSKTGLSKGVGLGFTFAMLHFSWGLQFWYAGVVVKEGTLKAGTAYAVVLISLFSGRALGDSLQLVDTVSKGKTAAARLFEVIERKTEIDSSRGEVFEKLEGTIEFCNVSFSYPARPEVPVFTGLNLEIPSGEVVALVGPSGSGKSSVVSLIQRFYDPQEGEVKIGGKDIKQMELKWLRRQMGLVSQEPILFAMSIEENILIGTPGATREDAMKAAEMANAHTFISELPNGYNTQVGDKGMQLSGGQKQRIAIARAILRSPVILLLDEATSALDSHSESVVQKALDNIMQGRTTVVIAHRLSTIRNADRIVVLENGSVVEAGTHKTLVQQEGVYASLVKAQEVSDKTTSVGKEVTGELEILEANVDNVETGSELSETTSRKVEDRRATHSFWFFKLMRPSWLFAILGSLGASASGTLAAVFPLLMANIIILYLKHQENKANVYILAVVGFGVVSFVSSMTQYFFGHTSGAKISRSIQVRALENLLKQEVGWFDSDENGGFSLTAKVSTSATAVRNLMSDTYSYFLQNSIALVLATVIAFICQWKVAFLAVSMLPVQIVAMSIMENFRKKGLTGGLKGYHTKASQLAGEATSNIRTVLSLGIEEHTAEKFNSLLLDTRATRFRRSVILGLVFGVAHGLMIMSSAVQLWYGIGLVRKGSTTFEPVFRAVSVVNYTIANCMEILRIVPDFVKGKAAVATMLKLSTRRSRINPDEYDHAAQDVSKPNLTGLIELENVTFAYPRRPEVYVLSGFNFRMEAGSTVALVGQSGSGKSSVLSLIQRFYDPFKGTVLLDGEDIRSLNVRWLRQQIGYVQQEPVLFGVSIKENILFGKEGATEAEVVEAARIANAHEFISGLPQGYETQAGERGVQLSGGQKQRIAIARAVIKSPRVLLLDEATSALDSESERIVQEAIDRILVEVSRTTVIVAHRLSTVQHADCIVVVDKGHVVESGKHEELVGRGGVYSSLLARC